MGQSATIMCAPTWDLASLSAMVEVAARDAGARFLDHGDQLEVWSQDGYLMLVADEDADTAFAVEDFATNEFLDERFRLEVHGLKFFTIRFHDVDVTRQVLRAFSQAAVSRGETGWIDTDYGWVIHVQDFVRKTDDNPHWDWRYESNPA
jgi:hypothetical protein